jgi:hypothetical protein
VFLTHEFPDLRLLFRLGSRSQFGSASSRFSSVETSLLLPCPILCCVRCSPLLSSGCGESEATDSVSLCHCLSSRLSSPSVSPALGFSLASLAGLAPAVLFSALVSLLFGAVLRRVRLRLTVLSVWLRLAPVIRLQCAVRITAAVTFCCSSLCSQFISPSLVLLIPAVFYGAESGFRLWRMIIGLLDFAADWVISCMGVELA